MTNQTLRYYMHDGPSAFRFELAGFLDQEGARQLEEDWRTASSVARGRTLIVDMTFVTGLDESASALIARWHREGAEIVAKSNLSAELAEEAIGRRLEVRRVARPAQDGTWLPFRTSRSAIGKLASLWSRVERPSRAENTGSNSAAARKNSLQPRSFDASADGAKRAS